jgi:hypothetical protein
MKVRNVIILVLALVAVSFFAGRYSTFGTRNSQYDELTAARRVMKVYQREINGREQTIYEKNQLIGTQREAIKAGLVDKALLKALNIKKASQITNLEADLAAARDSIDLEGQIVFVTDTIFTAPGDAENTYVKIPFNWTYSDEWINLNTGIGENKQGWFNLTAPTPFTIVLGGRDGKQVASVTTISPYVSVTDFNVIRMKEEKWYYKPWVPATGGALGGLLGGWLIWGR